MKDKRIIFRLDDNLSDKLREYAGKQGLSVSAVIRMAVEEYLKWNPADSALTQDDEDAGNEDHADS